MSTVDKALSILDLFSESQPNLGTTEIARKLSWDKSNVQRYVRDLSSRGLLDQDPRDKSYFLGAALTRYALVRDRTHPIAKELHHALEDLVSATGETAHACSYVGEALVTTAIVETKIRGTRVYIEPSVPLPLHASGSGIAFLSGSPQELVETLLSVELEEFTQQTPSNRADVLEHINIAREVGYAKMAGSYELDVIGIAAPIIGIDRQSIGAIAVATPMARYSAETEAVIAENVVRVAQHVSQAHGASFA